METSRYGSGSRGMEKSHPEPEERTPEYNPGNLYPSKIRRIHQKIRHQEEDVDVLERKRRFRGLKDKLR